jgi:hypothetical protein
MLINLKNTTWLKHRPIDSTKLSSHEKTLIRSDILVNSVNSWGNHIRVVLSDGSEAYIYTDHTNVAINTVLPYFNSERKIESIKQACIYYNVVNLSHIAYVLATVQHETANSYLPIEEYYGRQQAKRLKYDGGEDFYGRGFVMLTHRYNYQKVGKLLNLDLVSKPILALDPSVSLAILVKGMRDGWFTGKKLADFDRDDALDYIEARRIINGKDKADLIAKLAERHFTSLKN